MPHPPLPDRLYSLLPAIHRLRDAEQGDALRSLLAIIDSELHELEVDVDRLYENWFIETCDEWVVPYLGDLLAVRDLNAESPRTQGQERRAFVANTLAYRQRKGTTPVLEQLARDVTGWSARAAEALPLLATSQHLNHLRPNSTTIAIGRDRAPQQVGTPFESQVAYTTELSRTGSSQGTHNPSTIGLYLWRLPSYPIRRGTARMIEGPNCNSQGRWFTFSPLGYSSPLFNQPKTETEITTLAQDFHLPIPLTPSILRADLEKFKSDQESHYFGDQPALQIWQICDGKRIPIHPHEIIIANLNWEMQTNQYQINSASVFALPSLDRSNAKVAIDPEMGRLAFLGETIPDRVEVSYSYGFSGDVGGGPYDRTESPSDKTDVERIFATIPKPAQWIWDVQAEQPDYSVRSAVRDWNETAYTLQQCSDSTHIPIARLEVHPNGDIHRLPDSEDIQTSQRMRSGVVSGCEVITKLGDRRVTVSPGQAIDRQGREIHVRSRRRLSLSVYANQSVLVAITGKPVAGDPIWDVELVSVEQSLANAGLSMVVLARLTLDAQGQIAQIDQDVRQVFQPGILVGLHLPPVTAANGTMIARSGIVAIAAGMAVNREGQIITLDEASSINLSSYQTQSPQIVILFLKASENYRSPTLGAVRDIETGIVCLQGNGTYEGSLTIYVPEGKRFRLVAGNGDRPHLLGDVRIRGIAMTRQKPPGDCWIEGVLVEGDVTVLPGSLGNLILTHMTVVPQVGEVIVEQPSQLVDYDDANTMTFLTLVLYWASMIYSLIQLGFGDNGMSPKKRLTRLSTLGLQQVSRLLDTVQSAMEASQSAASLDDECLLLEGVGWLDYWSNLAFQQGRLDNAQLTVTVRRSICGTIALADTVPHLTVIDSIIDAGTEDKTGADAIAAIGAAVNMQRSTMFGTTQVRSLEASDSLFTGKVTTVRRQVGCLRFCSLPSDSKTPRRYQCQPDLALARQPERPAAITTLATNPFTADVFAGTAGNGVFQFLDLGKRWVPVNTGLNPLYVTAIAATTQPATGTITSRGTTISSTNAAFLEELEVGDTILAASQIRTIVAVNETSLTLDRPFREDLTPETPFMISTVVAGTTGGDLFRLMTTVRSATGTITQSGNTAIVSGQNTRFVQELMIGDLLLVGQVTRVVVAISSVNRIELNAPFPRSLSEESFQILRKSWKPLTKSETQFGEGIVTSDDEFLIGQETHFQNELTIGDTITIANESRIVTAIFSETRLQLNQSFPNPVINQSFVITKTPALTNTDITSLVAYKTRGRGTIAQEQIQNDRITLIGSDTQFTRQLRVGDTLTVNNKTRRVSAIHSDTVLEINAPLLENLSQPTTFYLHGFLASSNGGGVFRSSDRARHWSTINQGLANLDVQAIAINSNNGCLFAGTRGSGVFRSLDFGTTWTKSNPAVADTRLTGLINLHITALAIDPTTNMLFAGTARGGVFRSTDLGRRWEPVTDQLTNLNITTLMAVVQQGRGTLTIEEERVTGNGTVFTQELAIGDAITVQGKTRMVVDIQDDTTLTVDRFFEDDFTTATPFNITTLIAGTTDGMIFCSTNHGSSWNSSGTGLSDTDITTLAPWLQQGAGRITIENEVVTGINTRFLTEVAIGDSILVAGQTRKVVRISSNTSLTLDSPFTLSSPTSYFLPTLLAGTQVGSLFRSSIPVGPRPSSDDGPISSVHSGDRWLTFNTGLNYVDETLFLLNQLQPSFTAEQYGAPGYAQLSAACAGEIRMGAENRAEMGVFNHLKQPQREANLQATLDEYLRFGLHADLIYVT